MAKQTRKTITHTNGDIFIPVKSSLGKYYLQFRRSKAYKLFGVWRTAEATAEPADTDHYIGEVTSDNFDLKNPGYLPFEDVQVMMEMAKKL